MIYLDHAASTPMRLGAIDAMRPFLADHPGNPSGSHAAARATKSALEAAREAVAGLLGGAPNEVVFTGGGSESDNLAVKGAARAARARDPQLDGVVTTAIEHKAVLGAAHRLALEGFRVHEIAAAPDGAVALDVLADVLDARTAVVSVMLVNNETGIVQPLDAIAALVRDRAPNAVLHTDAVQAPQWLDLRVAAAAADLVAISGHKFGGPKGVGALLCRDGVALEPLIEGGGHELGRRAGTQNVAGIVALASALAETDATRTEETNRVAQLRDRFEATLLAKLDDMQVNGDPSRRVEGLLHVAFGGVEAEELLVVLDAAGVCAASGSACSSGAIEPSHVLTGMAIDTVRARSSVRFSLGWASTDADVDDAVPIVVDAVAQLRGE